MRNGTTEDAFRFTTALPNKGMAGTDPVRSRITFKEILRWQWRRHRAGLPREPPDGYRLPTVKPDLDFLASNHTESSVTWVGHSTLLLQMDGVNILTDPQFSRRASPLPFIGPRRRVPPIPDLPDLPRIDMVLISHNHYDHLDKRTVRRLNAQKGEPPRFFVPLGVRRWFMKQGIVDVAQLGWWEEETFHGIRIHCVPARHWSARTSFDRNRTLWCGWVLQGRDRQLFFAGDTGYSPHFAEVYRRLGAMDLAAIPIGHYEPRWLMEAAHLNPEEAVRVAADLHARCAVAIHWGTFPLTDEPLDEPPRRLRVALEEAAFPGERFVVLKRGETRTISQCISGNGVAL